MKYRKKMPLIEATQWVKHGDHSQVQNLPPPDPYQQISENPFCSLCGNHMTRHGFLDGVNGEEVVCPGDYIVTDRNDLPYRLSRGEFESQYEVYVRPPRHANVPVSDLEERNRRKRERHEIS